MVSRAEAGRGGSGVACLKSAARRGCWLPCVGVHRLLGPLLPPRQRVAIPLHQAI